MAEDLLSLSFSSTSTLSDNNLISIPIFDPTQSHNNKKIYTIIGIGDPIVDIISEINADIISEHELKLGDSIFASEDCANKNIEMFNILENNRSVNYVPGGSVQNTLRVLSWNLINDYDLINTRETFQITMLGSVGDDQYKNKIINSLEDIGVNPLLEILPGDKTSRCGVGIYQKEKLFITQLRASKRLSEKFIENNFDKISEHQALLIEGYLIQNKFNIIEKLCNYFLAKNKKIIFTLSAKFIVEMHYEKLIRLANEADIIAGNMEEALALGGEEGKNIQEIFNNIFRKLKPKKNRIILITDGANGQTTDAAKAKELYGLAAECFRQILESNTYSLNRSFTTLWDPASAWGPETVWCEQLDEGTNWGQWNNLTSKLMLKWYTACPDNGGWGSLFLSWEWYSSYEKGDKRRAGSCYTGAVPQIDPNNPAYDAAKYKDWYEPSIYGVNPYLQEVLGKGSAGTTTKQFHFNNGEWAPSIWSSKLWRTASANYQAWGDGHWSPTPIYWKRLPNIMLDYAECLFRTKGEDDATAWGLIDELRQRAFGINEKGHEQELTDKYLPYYNSYAKWSKRKEGENEDGGPFVINRTKYPIPFGTDLTAADVPSGVWPPLYREQHCLSHR